MAPDRLSRYRGALLGLAIGDALGAQVEFSKPGTFEPVRDLTGGGPHFLPPGAWTDDTSMMLCLAESLIALRDFDPVDQLERYVRWYRSGHMSATGDCFDIGNATQRALEAFERTSEPYPGEQFPKAAGNGAVMRVAPIPLAFGHNPAVAIEHARDSALTTHGAAEALDACRYLAGLMIGVLRDEPIERLLAPGGYEPFTGVWERAPLTRTVREVADGSFLTAEPAQAVGSGDGPARAIRATGRSYATLEAALWAIHRTDSFEDALLAAVNLGDDADTVGAVCGQLAGAFYGELEIPERWVTTLFHAERIGQYAEALDRLDRRLNARRERSTLPAIQDEPAVEGAAVGAGTPVLLWATSKSRGGEFWQRGLCAVAPPMSPPDGGEPVVWVAWLVEYEHARHQGRPPRAEQWPARLVFTDPRPPRRENYQVPVVKPTPRKLRLRSVAAR